MSSVELFEDIAAARDKLYRYVLARCRDPALADDVVQDTLARVLGAGQARAISAPIAFAYRIADNLLIDHYRRARRQSADEVSEAVACERPSPARQVEARNDLDRLRAALRAMPKQRREVFLRRRYDGQSCQDIARAMGVSVKAVEKHITRALQSLSAALPDCGGRANGESDAP